MAEGKHEKSRKDEAQRGSRRAAAAAHNYAEASRDAGEARRRGTEETSEAGSRGAEEAREAGSRGAEEIRSAADLAGQAASDIYSRSARETTQGLEAAVKYGTVLASGMQTFLQECIGCAQDVVQRNVDGMQNMMRSRSPGDFFAAQSDLLRDEVQAMIDSGSRLSEVSARIASDAARVFGEQVEGGEMGASRGGGAQAQGSQFGQGGRGGQQGQGGGMSGRGGQQQGGTSRT